MSDGLYTASGIFLDIVDSDWIKDTLPFEDIHINLEALPFSEPELGAHGETNKENPHKNEQLIECDHQSLLLPKNPIKAHYLSVANLPKINVSDELEIDNISS